MQLDARDVAALTLFDELATSADIVRHVETVS